MRGRRIAWRAAQMALAIIVIWFAWQAIPGDWPEIQRVWRDTTFRAGPLLLSTLVVFASYAVLIETWRQVVAAWGGRLSFGAAARIWFVSNLGKWIPGRIWQITAMGALSQRAGVSPVASIGSSLLIAVVNVLTAFVVILATAREAFHFANWTMYALVAGIVAVAFTPKLVPAMARRAAAAFGRNIDWPPIPQRTIIIAFVGCAIAWILYGVAFQILVSATFGVAAGATRSYIAAFTASYIAGYLTFFTVGGLGTREVLLAKLLADFGIATAATATVIVLVSRVWLTVLELLPGLILLAFTPKPTSSSATNT